MQHVKTGSLTEVKRLTCYIIQQECMFSFYMINHLCLYDMSNQSYALSLYVALLVSWVCTEGGRGGGEGVRTLPFASK